MPKVLKEVVSSSSEVKGNPDFGSTRQSILEVCNAMNSLQVQPYGKLNLLYTLLV